jgi:hypothetical protein
MPRDAETRVSSYPPHYRGFRSRSRLETTWAGAKNAPQWQPVTRWNHA